MKNQIKKTKIMETIKNWGASCQILLIAGALHFVMSCTKPPIIFQDGDKDGTKNGIGKKKGKEGDGKEGSGKEGNGKEGNGDDNNTVPFGDEQKNASETQFLPQQQGVRMPGVKYELSTGQSHQGSGNNDNRNNYEGSGINQTTGNQVRPGIYLKPISKTKDLPIFGEYRIAMDGLPQEIVQEADLHICHEIKTFQEPEKPIQPNTPIAPTERQKAVAEAEKNPEQNGIMSMPMLLSDQWTRIPIPMGATLTHVNIVQGAGIQIAEDKTNKQRYIKSKGLRNHKDVMFISFLYTTNGTPIVTNLKETPYAYTEKEIQTLKYTARKAISRYKTPINYNGSEQTLLGHIDTIANTNMSEEEKVDACTKILKMIGRYGVDQEADNIYKTTEDYIANMFRYPLITDDKGNIFMFGDCDASTGIWLYLCIGAGVDPHKVQMGTTDLGKKTVGEKPHAMGAYKGKLYDTNFLLIQKQEVLNPRILGEQEAKAQKNSIKEKEHDHHNHNTIDFLAFLIEPSDSLFHYREFSANPDIDGALMHIQNREGYKTTHTKFFGQMEQIKQTYKISTNELITHIKQILQNKGDYESIIEKISREEGPFWNWSPQRQKGFLDELYKLVEAKEKTAPTHVSLKEYTECMMPKDIIRRCFKYEERGNTKTIRFSTDNIERENTATEKYRRYSINFRDFRDIYQKEFVHLDHETLSIHGKFTNTEKEPSIINISPKIKFLSIHVPKTKGFTVGIEGNTILRQITLQNVQINESTTTIKADNVIRTTYNKNPFPIFLATQEPGYIQNILQLDEEDQGIQNRGQTPIAKGGNIRNIDTITEDDMKKIFLGTDRAEIYDCNIPTGTYDIYTPETIFITNADTKYTLNPKVKKFDSSNILTIQGKEGGNSVKLTNIKNINRYTGTNVTLQLSFIELIEQGKTMEHIGHTANQKNTVLYSKLFIGKIDLGKTIKNYFDNTNQKRSHEYGIDENMIKQGITIEGIDITNINNHQAMKNILRQKGYVREVQKRQANANTYITKYRITRNGSQQSLTFTTCE